MGDTEDLLASRFLWTFLTTLSAVVEERERVRIAATGLSSVVPCELTGLGVSRDPEGEYQLEVYQDGRALEPTVRSELTRALRGLADSASRPPGRHTLGSEAIPESVRACGVDHLVLVPLATLHTDIGFLVAGRAGPSPFSPNEECALLTVAEHLATSLENLRLLARLKQHSETLTERVAERTEALRKSQERRRMLLDINNAIITNRDRASLFGAVTQALEPVLPFDSMGLTLYDRESDALQVYALGGVAPARSAVSVGKTFPRRRSHLEDVLRHRRPVIRSDLSANRVGLEEQLFEAGIRSTLAVPLLTGDTPLGALAVGSRSPDTYSNDHAQLLEEVAQQVALAVENALAHEEIESLKSRLEEENLYLQEELEHQHNFGEILGESVAITGLVRAVQTVAPTDVNVVVTGETGTGKELVARAIHLASARRDKPLIRVNCASIPTELFESEFFGHVRGSFTGAVRDRVGRFELADRGTLFLDEIGEIPLSMQSKLLRVLQEGEFERVGEERTRRVDVRVVAATNRNLVEEIAAGRFRQDLFYRLNVFPIEVAPLRERAGDVPLLAAHYLRLAARKLKRKPPPLSASAIQQLNNYLWPGNVRELQNVIERAVIVSGGGPLRIDLPTVPSVVTSSPHTKTGLASEVISEDEKRTRDRENIRAALRKTHWKIAGKGGAAELLGLKPTTLASRIRKLGISRDD